jgi:hypothetical protein
VDDRDVTRKGLQLAHGLDPGDTQQLQPLGVAIAVAERVAQDQEDQDDRDAHGDHDHRPELPPDGRQLLERPHRHAATP